MQAQRTGRITGHVRIVTRKRGPQFYLAYRIPEPAHPEGYRQVQKLVGPAWVDRNGHPRKGRCPEWAFTRADADAKLREAMVEAERGNFPGANSTGVTFADAAAVWIRNVEDKGRKASTIADYRLALYGGKKQRRRNASPSLVGTFGSMRLEDVTTDVIDHWQARLSERVSARTRQKLLVILHGIFKRAQRVYGLRDNPVTHVERPSQKRSGEIDVLDPSEVHALVRAAESEQDAAIFFTAAFTGLRLGELRALRWRDVDFGLQRIQVRRSFSYGSFATPKSGKVRSVPMFDQVLARLDSLSKRETFTDDEDLVFPGIVGTPIDASSLRKRYKAALVTAELRELRFHDLRHTFGSLAVREFSIFEVKEMMGHANVQTTMVYLHYRPGADDAERLARAFGAADAEPLIEVAA